MNKTDIINALSAALRAEGVPNHAEITTAIQAVKIGSPIALKRARRALANALCAGREDTLADDERELCRYVLSAISDEGGRLPQGDGKLSHIHLRVESGRKSAYVRAAQSNSESLSEWIARHCDREAGYQP